MPTLMLETIPTTLKGLVQWVCWRYETRNGKRTKVPYMPDGRRASTTDPQTWSVFADCVQASAPFDGIGIVCANGLAGIDLDYCIDETGNLSELAQSVVQVLNSYTEITPSGRGLHCLCFAQLPGGNRRNAEKQIEMYDSARYLTVTGNHFPNTPLTIEKREVELARLHTELLGAREPITQLASSPVKRAEVSLDDQELIARAEQARNGNEFRRLWHGDLSQHNSNHSEADLAFCAHLAFWTGMDAARMDHLFRQSGLMRAKWDERHRADGATYGQMTIEKALSGVHNYFGSHRNGHGNGNGNGNEHPLKSLSEPDPSKDASDLDALIEALAEQPQEAREEGQLRQLFVALSKLSEFSLARYQSTVTEKLNLTHREFRRLLNAVMREALKEARKEPPPEVISERYPIVAPALDFVDDLAVVTVPVLMLLDRKPVYRPCVVTSTRETLMLNEPGLLDIGGRRVLLGSAPQVIDGVARWDWPDVQRFVQGDAPDPIETFLMVEGVYAKYLDFCEPHTSDVLTLWDFGYLLNNLGGTFVLMLLTPYIYGLFNTRPLHTVAEALPTIVLPQLIEKILFGVSSQ